jgi:nitroimidazol reductase NimA-like FMN-containing flavoprotein (pyridoxamine 5'-phosphate oxidase superfamily)
MRERGVQDRAETYAILDEGLVAHVGFVDPDSGEPTVIPVAYARDGDTLLLHGSTGSRMFRALKAGAQICVTVTILDGLVVARSAFNSSMNYRSVMAFGRASVLEGEEQGRALDVITEHLIPGMTAYGRPATAKEMAQTMVLSLPLDDVTAKKREGGANDPEDAHLPIWAGHLPIAIHFGEPIPDLGATHLEVPDHVRDFALRMESTQPTAEFEEDDESDNGDVWFDLGR